MSSDQNPGYQDGRLFKASLLPGLLGIMTNYGNRQLVQRDDRAFWTLQRTKTDQF